MTEHYVTRDDFVKVTDTMSSIQETTLRVDERVKVLLERQGKSDININEIRDNISNLVNRVSILESKDATEMKTQVDKNREKISAIENQLNILTLKESHHDGRWKIIFDYVGKVIWIIVSAYILWRLGLNAAPIS